MPALGAGGSTLIDANLLLVLLTGIVSRSALGSAPHVSEYNPEMWDLLALDVRSYARVVTTPNVLTEVSNLSGKMSAPLRSNVRRALAERLPGWEEIYVPSTTAVAEPHFARLGLTDAVMLTLRRRPVTVLTTDAGLYEALGRGGVPVVNYWHRWAELL